MKTKFINLKKIFFLLPGILIISTLNGQPSSTFEEHALTSESYWDGSDMSGGFSSGDAYFYNSYSPTYMSNTGFAYSNKTDNTTAGYTNIFSAITGSGYHSDLYAVANTFGPLGIKLTGSASGQPVRGFFATNTTYAALDMVEGTPGISKKFGGDDGNDEDWFRLTVKGYMNGTVKNDSVNFYLADFRFADNDLDYIVDTWKWVDLSSLGNVDSLSFSLSSSDVGMYGMNTPAYFAMDDFNKPVFAPAAGISGTTAMHKDSAAFISWALNCTIVRGPQDISNPGAGNASAGTEADATGKAGSGIVSLGDGGSATLTFANPVMNGEGHDFAVFENGFTSGNFAFLELAFVEVSSDGINFFRFPATTLTSDSSQLGSFGLTDAKLIHNFAGKYTSGFGTPFDLDVLKDEPGLDVNNITHIRIVDVTGSLDPEFASFDMNGNRVNDPWPTAFASSGFDLDGVGVINSANATGNASAFNKDEVMIYPNPSFKASQITISFDNNSGNDSEIQVYDFSGKMIRQVFSNENRFLVNVDDLKPGVYSVKISNEGRLFIRKIVIN